MCSIEHRMTEIYCFVDDFLKARPALSGWRRSPHAAPRFTDSEVLTIALLQADVGTDTLKRTYLLVAQNWRSAFPRLPSYAQWLARLHRLTRHVGALLAATCGHGTPQARLYLIDSKPIPLCHPLRHGRVRLLREDGARFGKTSKGWFFGFKLHALRHISGRVLSLRLTPANYDDREPAAALAEEAESLLITRADAPERKFLLSQVRQGVETMFSQWWHQFIDRVFSRSWDGLWNTIKLKVLRYNLVHAGVLSA